MEQGPAPTLATVTAFVLVALHARPGRAEEPAPVPSPADRRFEGDLTALVGVRRLPLVGFDAPLRASGYQSFPRFVPTLSAWFDVVVWRLRLRFGGTGAWMSAPSREASNAIHASFFELRVDAGVDFLRWRELTGFVLAGIGGSTLTIDAHAPSWSYLAASAAAVGNPDSILRDASFFTVQTGFEELVPLGTLQGHRVTLPVSLQAGYSQQLGLGPWFADGGGRVEGGDAPHLDMSGAWVSLGCGLGFL